MDRDALVASLEVAIGEAFPEHEELAALNVVGGGPR